MTPIIDSPTTMPSTPTPQPMTKPIFADQMADAGAFILILKVGMAAGDLTAIAERILYPIQVRVNGQPMTIRSVAEFERHFGGIFNDHLQQVIAGAGQNDLELQLDGIKAADGALWFNQFRVDGACTQDKFLITRINN
jgi:hypothetical protein